MAEMKKECSCGAVIYKKTAEGLRYLLIKDRHDNYGFPKGHTEEGETLKETALREIKEEVGLKVCLDEDFSYSFEYLINDGSILKTVYYFLADMEDKEAFINDGEAKEIILVPYEDALELATFEQTRELIRQANEYLLKKGRSL